jgi:uncharacterized protein (DUF934 family)
MEWMILGSIERLDIAVHRSRGREIVGVELSPDDRDEDERPEIRVPILIAVTTRTFTARRIVPAADLLRRCRRCSQLTMAHENRYSACRRPAKSERSLE